MAGNAAGVARETAEDIAARTAPGQDAAFFLEAEVGDDFWALDVGRFEPPLGTGLGMKELGEDGAAVEAGGFPA